ncbi:MAG: hypothetical protein JO257_14560, partial [Deltaproteobacteria bacterium]|nr:hypothetical protein [Deltaproteobacteria bacterium]
MLRARLLLVVVAGFGCNKNLSWSPGGSSSSSSPSSSSGGGGGGGGGGGDADSDGDGQGAVTTPHTSGPKFVALLAKLDDPKPQKNFEYQDASDRWPYYRKMLGEPWAEFKKEFGMDASAPASIDGDSFEADWYQQLKKDANATLTGPDYWCSKPFNASAITMDVKYALSQSKQCVAAFKSVKSFRCVDDPKQDGLAQFEMTK